MLKSVMYRYAAALSLIASASLPTFAQEPVRELADVQLGANAQQVRAQVEKAHPNHQYVEQEYDIEGFPYKVQAWRTTNPQGKYYYEQEHDSIAIASFTDGQVYQVSRAQTVSQGAMAEKVLLDAAEKQFGAPVSKSYGRYTWSVGQCYDAHARRIGKPGSTIEKPRRFDMEKDVYIMSRFYTQFGEKCDYQAELNYETDNEGFVTHYTTTILDTKKVMARFTAFQQQSGSAAQTKDNPKF